MNSIQKQFVWISAAVFLLTALFALMLKGMGDIFLQPIFLHLFIRYDLSAALLSLVMIATALLALKWIPHKVIDKILESFVGKAPTIAVFFLVFTIYGTIRIYHNHPLSMDEYMAFFQAQIFAEGKLWGHFPSYLVQWLLIPKFFSVFSVQSGNVISSYWPGFALLLTPFMKLGMPWLLNPLLGSGTILLAYYYCRKLFANEHFSSWVLLLTIASPVFVVNSISYYSMPAHLFFNMLFATLLLELSAWRLIAAGVVGSLALVLHNPIPHTLFALPWIVWLLCQPRRFRNLGYILAGYIPLVVVLGLGWVHLQGLIATGANEATTQLYSASSSDFNVHTEHSLSFALLVEKIYKLCLVKPLAMLGSVFRLPDGDILWVRLLGLFKIFVWAVPGLPILALFGIREGLKNTHLKLWLCSATLTFVAFLFVPMDQGHGWGYRYFHSVWIVLPLFAAVFLVLSTQDVWLKRLVCLLALFSLFMGISLRFGQVYQFIVEHLNQLPPLKENQKQICFVDPINGYYSKDLIQNDPFLRDDIIFVFSHGIFQNRIFLNRYFPEASKFSQKGLNSVWLINSNNERF